MLFKNSTEKIGGTKRFFSQKFSPFNLEGKFVAKALKVAKARSNF